MKIITYCRQHNISVINEPIWGKHVGGIIFTPSLAQNILKFSQQRIILYTTSGGLHSDLFLSRQILVINRGGDQWYPNLPHVDLNAYRPRRTDTVILEDDLDLITLLISKGVKNIVTIGTNSVIRNLATKTQRISPNNNLMMSYVNLE